MERFQKLRETVFQDPQSYFRHFAALSDAEADEVAHGIWREINGKNLQREHPADAWPRRPRAPQGRGPPGHGGAAPQALSVS